MLKHLRLKDYRNFASLQLDFHPRLNILIGPNGAGKTNILESLIVLSNTKSFRGNDDKELIQKGNDACLLELKAKDKLRIVISKLGKSLFINDEAVSKTSAFIGRFNSLLFKPGDVEIFDQSSKERRKLMDLEIGKIDPSYLRALLIYTKLLKDKNHLLKQEKIDFNYLDILDEAMVEPILEIINKRETFIAYINDCLSDIYFKLAGEKRKISLFYKSHFLKDKKAILEKLKDNRQRDLFLRCGCLGPHREDIVFYFDDYLLNSIASQGQKRMTVIAFKMAIMNYIEKTTKEKPLILLDDIFSELDLGNRRRLLNCLSGIGQTIITGTDVLNLNVGSNLRIMEIKKGAINAINDY